MTVLTLKVGGLQTNCYIVADDKGRAAVIDPGDEAGRIAESLQDNGFEPLYIFLTHGHFDHILAVPALKAATGAPVVIHGGDAHCLTDQRASLGHYRCDTAGAAADLPARDGDEFSVGGLTFQYLHTPGHTPGSCVLVCGDHLFSGDTLFAGSCGRCDLPGGDYRAMLRSLKRLGDLAGDFKVCPGHGPSTTLGAERAANPYMREAREQ